MLSRGDAVVYKCRGLYKVEDIGTLDFSFVDNSKQYYTLQSVEDAGDKAYVPAEDETNIRRPVSRDEALALIRRIPQIEVLQVKNEKLREQEYKDCIADFCPESCFLNMPCTVSLLSHSGSRQGRCRSLSQSMQMGRKRRKHDRK